MPNQQTILEKTETLSKYGLSAETVEKISRLKDEPDWMRQKRLEAWWLYEKMPMPSRQDEAWRRTDISALRLDNIVPFSKPQRDLYDKNELLTKIQRQSASRPGNQKDGLLIHHNSTAVYRELKQKLAEKGVIFTDMDTAVRKYPELVREYFMTGCVLPTDGKFSALNGAFWSGGTFLYVPEGVEIILPLRNMTWVDKPELGVFPHSLVIAEPRSKVIYIEEYASLDRVGQSLHNGLVEVYAKEGANVQFISLQNWGHHFYQLALQRGLAERDSTIRWFNGTFGGKISKINIESLLQGTGARTEILGMYFGDGIQHFDHGTAQDHSAAHTTSDLLFKGVLEDQARSVFQGLIHVHKSAQKSDAYQTNRNLILSDNARADSIPRLEIEANDVRCTHGVTAGQVNEEELFYLMSRGLNRKEAVRLIVDGFFEPVIEQLPLDKIQEILRRIVSRKIR